MLDIQNNAEQNLLKKKELELREEELAVRKLELEKSSKTGGPKLKLWEITNQVQEEEIDAVEDKKMTCNCGAPECRGRLL